MPRRRRRQWVVVKCKPGRERYACKNIRNQNREPYMPRLIEGKRVTPLFPGYVFVKLNDDGAWRWLQGTYGVLHVVRIGVEPAFVLNEHIASLKKREKDGVIELPSAPIKKLKAGDAIEVIKGAMEGWQGLFKGMSGHNRARVLFNNLFGASREIDMDVRHLHAA